MYNVTFELSGDAKFNVCLTNLNPSMPASVIVLCGYVKLGFIPVNVIPDYPSVNLNLSASLV